MQRKPLNQVDDKREGYSLAYTYEYIHPHQEMWMGKCLKVMTGRLNNQTKWLPWKTKCTIHSKISLQQMKEVSVPGIFDETQPASRWHDLKRRCLPIGQPRWYVTPWHDNTMRMLDVWGRLSGTDVQREDPLTSQQWVRERGMRWAPNSIADLGKK